MRADRKGRDHIENLSILDLFNSFYLLSLPELRHGTPTSSRKYLFKFRSLVFSRQETLFMLNILQSGDFLNCKNEFWYFKIR